MSRDGLKIALIVSLAFNMAVVGALAYGFARRTASDRFCPPPGRGVPPDSFGGGCGRFAREIGVPRERAARFSHMMADTSGGTQETRGRLQRARGELIELMSVSKPDEKSIMAKVDEISALQGELEKRLIQRLLGASSTLDAKERERFMRAIRFRCMPRESGLPCGPGGPGEESEVR
jgi:Spy/CpxP family protein refolding chaperone